MPTYVSSMHISTTKDPTVAALTEFSKPNPWFQHLSPYAKIRSPIIAVRRQYQACLLGPYEKLPRTET